MDPLTHVLAALALLPVAAGVSGVWRGILRERQR